jgi:hypothetical protein
VGRLRNGETVRGSWARRGCGSGDMLEGVHVHCGGGEVGLRSSCILKLVLLLLLVLLLVLVLVLAG